ncbi:8037_t:CDS:1, partial [Racocetra persica]
MSIESAILFNALRLTAYTGFVNQVRTNRQSNSYKQKVKFVQADSQIRTSR